MSSPIATVRPNGYGGWTAEVYYEHGEAISSVGFRYAEDAAEWLDDDEPDAEVLTPDAFDAEVARRDAEAEARRLTPPLL